MFGRSTFMNSLNSTSNVNSPSSSSSSTTTSTTTSNPVQHRIDTDNTAQDPQDLNDYEEVIAKIKKADELAEDKMAKMKAFEQIVAEKIKDNSPAAKKARLRRTMRAAYGEFMCTVLFLFPQFCVNINGHLKNYDPDVIALQVSLTAGFSAVAVCFAFSSISGANFNPAVSLALGITRKMSKRRVAMYIFAQLLASIVSISLAASLFDLQHNPSYNSYKELFFFTSHGDDDEKDNNAYQNSKVFATEFVTTFLFTYVIFTAAFEDAEKGKVDTMSLKQITESAGLVVYTTTPNSSTAFAPFIIGFTLFSLSMTNGGSGSVFNPAGLFGPALVCDRWGLIPLYLSAEFLGACLAGIVVGKLHNFGVNNEEGTGADITAANIQEIELSDRDKRESNRIRESMS